MKNSIQAIKYIDKIIGSLLFEMLPERIVRSKKKTNRVLVIRPGGIGDAALLAPVLSMIKGRYPFIRMDILCESRNSGIFRALCFVDDIFVYNNPLQLLKVMITPYDFVADTEQSHFLSAVICRLSRWAYTMGYEAYGRGRMFDHAEGYDQEGYEAYMFLKLFRHYFDLPERLEWTCDYFKPLRVSQRKTIKSLETPGKVLVCLFPGATIDERLWPEDRWASVIDFLQKQGCKPVLLGGSREMDQCRRIQKICHHDDVANMCGKLSLLETAWLFKKANLLISTDSGILHLGVMCNLPTISLFGAGIKRKWAPKGERHSVISRKLSCSPCTIYGHTPACPNGNRCMLEISSDEVVACIRNYLKKNLVKKKSKK